MSEKLSDVVTIISGGTPKTSVKEFWDGDIDWLAVADFNSSNRYVSSASKKITDLGLNNSNTKMLEKDDLIISARGTVGAIAQLTKPMAFNQSCFGLRGKKDKLDTDYLYYWLKNYVDVLLNKSQGSVFNTINLSTFDDIKIELPSIVDQRKISNLLTLLDDKIQTNNQINQELEAMAKTLYDYWFVQFDFPDQNGKPYKSSGGKMVYHPELKREIPEGWGNSTLGEFADLYQPKTISDKEMIEDGEYLVYGANGIIGCYSEYNHEDSMVTISCRGNCGIINVTRPYSWITGNSMVVKPKDDIYNIDYISNLLLSLSISSVITGSVQKQLTRTSLVPLKIIIPNKEIIEKYRAITNVSFEKRKAIQIEVEQLTQLRDWLLPILMNGQVKVE